MSVLMRFTPGGLTVEKYEEVTRRLEADGVWPPDGMELHVFFGSDDDLRVSEVWDSEEKFQAFGEHLMPVLADVGIEIREPESLPVHHLVKR